MASIILASILMSAISSTSAYDFYVGGKDGWVQNPREGYNDWASRMRFQVNDKLVFKYKKEEDSILVVKEEDYDSCNVKNPIQKLEGGDSIFQFGRSGPFFFTSGVPDKCNKGEKMIVVVMAMRNKNPSISPSPSPSLSPPTKSPSQSPLSSPSLSPSSSSSPSLSPPTKSPSLSPSPSSSSPLSPSPLSPPSPSSSPLLSPQSSSPSPLLPPLLSPQSSPLTSPSSSPLPQFMVPVGAPDSDIVGSTGHEPGASPPSPPKSNSYVLTVPRVMLVVVSLALAHAILG